MKEQIANQRRPKTPTVPNTKRAVALIDDDGNVVKQFESTAEASRATGCNQNSIGRVCKGKQKTALGLRWRYVD